MSNIFLAISLGIWFFAIYHRSKYFLHMIQIEGYKNNNFKKWINEFSYKAFPKKLKYIFFGIIKATVICIIALIIAKDEIFTIIYMLLWIGGIADSIRFKRDKAKKELVFTKRAKRLFASNFIVIIIEILIIAFILMLLPYEKYYTYPLALLLLSTIYYFEPYNMILANILVAPVEKKINKYYYDKAYNKIRTFKNLKIVGITGSFGKTSTKFITSTILQEKYKVLKTPESYNTPMGISKVINNDLTDEYEVFVVEMGARNIGDIKEVARLANPKIGVLTAVGPTHLETFKNVENIMKTKYELIEELPPEGIAIFNYDNKYIRKLADKTFKEKILYGMEDTEKLDIYATDLEISEFGSTFILNDREGNSVKCRTKLLGRHNIQNLLAGAAVAKALGLTLEEIAKGIEKVEPVPHRLQLINPGTGVIVIDDAFNSNPVGAKAALDVINQFKDRRKIIVTPGMVELGEQEFEANKEFGKNIANVCDYVILIGKNRTKPIFEGLREMNYSKDKIFVVSTLNEATVKLQELVKPGDVVLFENDLPDTYNE
ncbi:UDP-N-acetylmuramyl peptide synthase [Caloranaerobacter azorensis H53214]|uniref:UDP-N-acetylmuramyl peptide synthase n=1 Tax=Caloranaerobacter azorensis H53214 TaxID=1156417 RepID=A0A096DJY1_9FIRM|nr:UDP-N-acetylmuramoyl-tripeptide--D-alanyl-D-alanine ligase [Caloranaerobacter azorensis]KGG79556.1 UDP-N-acetylmuramyl peptide synthase [Caloranaerobacter azorensis H53214]